MRALVQRVTKARVIVEGAVTGQIGKGLLVFLAVRHDDTSERAADLARKIAHLRIFPDAQGKMNLSVRDVSGELLVVSQFTLYADTRRGNRPSYSEAAGTELAEQLYTQFVSFCQGSGVPVSTGVFRAHMDVELVNEGPVTLMCCSER